MNSWYFILNLACMLIFIITVIPRLNDIGKDKMTMVWHVRRLGLVLAGAASVGLIYLQFIPPDQTGDALRNYVSFMRQGRFFDTMLHIGFALTWITTPNHPPFWKYITKGNSPELRNRRYSDEP